MGINFLQTLASKSPPSTTFLIFTKPSRTQNQNFLPFPQRSLRISSTNSTNSTSSDNKSNNTGGDNEPPPFPVPPPTTQPNNNVEIRFRRRSRRQSKQQKQDGPKAQASATAPAPPKKWEEMSVSEKAIELYVGEKGLLFWLNKFAYASIYIIIGGWILFRFVGPALNLYQLDSAPLSPTSIFKGS